MKNYGPIKRVARGHFTNSRNTNIYFKCIVIQSEKCHYQLQDFFSFFFFLSFLAFLSLDSLSSLELELLLFFFL
jgi:hypothetical protein